MTENRNIDGKKIMVRDYVFTWSNLISATRVIITIPIIYLHVQNNFQVDIWITLLIIYGIISDYLDGLTARLRDEITEVGKLLDPIADKVMAVVLFAYTVWLGLVPLWFFIVAVIRDLLIVGGSIYIKKKFGKVAMSIMSGKISVNVLALYWLSVFFFPEYITVHFYLMIISLAIMLISFLDYYNRFNKIIKGAEFN
ncbi:MAG: CDP-alcohol phosphatidyltransferase family protein [Balneolaceae bacterium]